MDLAFAERMVGAFAVIALVLFALQFVAKAGWRERVAGRGGRRLVTVLETTFLPNSASLHVVKIGERCIVIGRSGNHIASLAEIPPETMEAWLAAQSASPLGDGALGALARRLGHRTGG